MTRLIDIGNLQSLISGSAIERLPIWIVPITQISSLAMKNLMMLTRMKLPGHEGRKVAGLIASEIYKSRSLGEIPECAATQTEAFNPRLSKHDIRQVMGKFTAMERRLIVFAVLTRENIGLAASATHTSLRQRGWADDGLKKAQSIARRAPRHISSKLVFWESDNQQKPRPLNDIGSKFRRATKMHWEVFADLFRDYLKSSTQGCRA